MVRHALLFLALAAPAAAQTPFGFSGTQTGVSPSAAASPLSAASLNAAGAGKADVANPHVTGTLTVTANGSPVVRTDASGNGYFTGNVYVNSSGSTSPAPVIYTVATLPACTLTTEGVRVGVSDLSTPAFLASPVGGGSVHGPVYCSGSTGWKVG